MRARLRPGRRLNSRRASPTTGGFKGLEDYEYRHRTPIPGLSAPRCGRCTPRLWATARRVAMRPLRLGAPEVVSRRGGPSRRRTGSGFGGWTGSSPCARSAAPSASGWACWTPTRSPELEMSGADAAAALDALTTSRLPQVGNAGSPPCSLQPGGWRTAMTVTRLAKTASVVYRRTIEEADYATLAPVPSQRGRARSTSLPVSWASWSSPARSPGCCWAAAPRRRWTTRRSRGCRRSASRCPESRCGRCGSASPGSSGGSCTCPRRTCWACTALVAARADLGLADVGNRALNSLPVEKAYRTFTRPDPRRQDRSRPGWDVAPLGKGDFLGRAALVRRGERPGRAGRVRPVDRGRRRGLRRRARRSTRVTGPWLVSSGGYGYTTGAGHALVAARPWCRPAVAVEVVGERCATRSSPSPPTMKQPGDGLATSTEAEAACGRSTTSRAVE